jgi:arylsulfatase A-like enzyme
VPELVRWPGHIPAGVVSNQIIQHHDWLPTFLAAAGDPDIVEKLKQGHAAGTRPSGCISTATTCFPT